MRASESPVFLRSARSDALSSARRAYFPANIINVGILAHVDAGKTSLTERLLYHAGVIEKPGSVDAGNTQTDSLALERQRGITIQSAVVSFAVGDFTVNLIDTPGHPDFIAEVDRVLGVLDGAVLVVSAVEGVQAQTRVLMRALRRLGIPTILFMNKIDRGAAQCERVLRDIGEKLTPCVVAMGAVGSMGSRGAFYTPYGTDDADFANQLGERLADRDESLLAAYVEDEAVSYRRLRDGLAAQTKRGLLHPVFFGSAITGAGVDSLATGITELLPAADGDEDGPVSGTVFKIERGPSGEKIAYVRMFSGTVRVRDRLAFGRGREGRVTGIHVFDGGLAERRGSVAAGRIGKLWGLDDIQTGDAIGIPRAGSGHVHFAPPTLEAVVVPRRPAERGILHTALAQLAEQDPLIKPRWDDIRQEITLSLYGEVQKEVIQATLAHDFHIDADFRETATIHIERPIGTGASVEIIGKETNPFLATVGLRVEPAPLNAGVIYRRDVELGALPLPFHKAIEESVKHTLQQGLFGWRVLDCAITLTHSGYWARQSSAHGGFDASMSSTAGDFRNLTPLVLMAALKEAGTTVCEPVQRFYLEIPAEALSRIMPVLSRLSAVPQTPVQKGAAIVLEGEIPAAQAGQLQRQLLSLTGGESMLECSFDHYEPVRGRIPVRPRSDHNPLNRREYLLHVAKRVW